MKALIEYEDGSRCLRGFAVQRIGDGMLRVGSMLFKTTGPTWFEAEWNEKTQRWRKGGTARILEVRE